MGRMKVGSLFAGIGGFDEGFITAGMELMWQCEADERCLEVLRYRYTGTKTYEDVREIDGKTVEPVDVLCGGFPCQDLSVAGRRAGLAGERSGLFHQFMRILGELSPQPRFVVVENVPGLLSSNKGRDMGTVLTAMEERGYGWAYRVLDSQFFGVPQRRRRVFIVGCLGDWRGAAKILFESESVCGNPQKGRKAGEGVAHTTAPCLAASGRGVERCGESRGQDPVVAFTQNQNGDVLTTAKAPSMGTNQNATGRNTPKVCAYGGNNTQGPIDKATACNAHGGPCGRMDFESETFVTAFAQNQRGEIRTSQVSPQLTTGGGKPNEGYPAVAFSNRGHGTGEVTETIRSDPHGAHPVVAFDGYNQNISKIAQTVRGNKSDGDHAGMVCNQMQVRRLTPKECERLQGFPDDWTRWGIDRKGEIKEMADGPRYKMLGNAVTVNVSEWIGRRIMGAI